jgi:hypothetical protein
MPLSSPAERKELHLRRVEVRGYERADGLWDIEGYLNDSKTYGFSNHDRGRVEAGEPIHEMWLRLTLDQEFVVRAAEAVTDQGPYKICPSANPNFERLVGIKIGPGYRRKVQEMLGGVQGCTHLVELLGPMATTAFQTMWPVLARRRKNEEKAKGRPAMLNTCVAYATDSPVVKRNWPEHYTGS